MNHQVTDQAAVGGKPPQLNFVRSSGRLSSFSAVCPSSRNHILQTIEKQEPDQGGRVDAMFREWQSAVRSYACENVLRLAQFWESPDKNISNRTPSCCENTRHGAGDS